MDITFMDETNQVSETKIKEIDDLLQFAADSSKLARRNRNVCHIHGQCSNPSNQS
jgi:hypothetical protein